MAVVSIHTPWFGFARALARSSWYSKIQTNNNQTYMATINGLLTLSWSVPSRSSDKYLREFVRLDEEKDQRLKRINSNDIHRQRVFLFSERISFFPIILVISVITGTICIIFGVLRRVRNLLGFCCESCDPFQESFDGFGPSFSTSAYKPFFDRIIL